MQGKFSEKSYEIELNWFHRKMALNIFSWKVSIKRTLTKGTILIVKWKLLF